MPRVFENISPATMIWARKDAGYPDIESAAKKLGHAPEKISGWEEGKSRPTVAELRKVAKVYHRPPCFFCQEEIQEEFKIQRPVDFRSLSRDDPEHWTPNLIFMIRQAHDRQEWAQELLGDEAESQGWVASTSVNKIKDPEPLAEKIRDWLGISDRKQRECSNARDFLEVLIRLVESKGVFVSRYRPDMNRYRSIEPRIFRGIALTDAVAPLVVLNPKDAVRGQIFTLLHELVHLWVDAPGLSNREPDRYANTGNRKIEAVCNRIAGLVLMPERWFLAEWEKHFHLSDDVRIQAVSDVFLVSKESVARRLYDNDEMTWERYMALRERYQGERQVEKERKKAGNSQKSYGVGMSRGRRVYLEHGARFVDLAFENYQDQEISVVWLSRVVDMGVMSLGKLAKEAGFDSYDWE